METILTNSRNVICYFQEKLFFFARDQNFSLKLTFEILPKNFFWPKILNVLFIQKRRVSSGEILPVLSDRSQMFQSAFWEALFSAKRLPGIGKFTSNFALSARPFLGNANNSRSLFLTTGMINQFRTFLRSRLSFNSWSCFSPIKIISNQKVFSSEKLQFSDLSLSIW